MAALPIHIIVEILRDEHGVLNACYHEFVVVEVVVPTRKVTFKESYNFHSKIVLELCLKPMTLKVIDGRRQL